MRKKITTVIVITSLFIFMSSRTTFAQKFEVGDNVAGVGIGLGSTVGYTYGSSSPAISAQFEHGQWDMGGPGTISLGGFFGYKTYSYDANLYWGNYSQKWTYIIIGARSAYHYNGLSSEKFDPYGGVMVSYEIITYSYSNTYSSAYNNPFYSNLGDANRGSYGSGIRFTLYAGGRYYISDQFAIYGELGFGNAILTLGIAYKF